MSNPTKRGGSRAPVFRLMTVRNDEHGWGKEQGTRSSTTLPQRSTVEKRNFLNRWRGIALRSALA